MFGESLKSYESTVKVKKTKALQSKGASSEFEQFS